MLEINIITLFPKLFEEYKNVLPINRAIQNNLLKLNIINLRDCAIDKRGTVDDKPYGGGIGMVLRPEPIYEALGNIQNKEEVIFLNPKGKIFNQNMAKSLSQKNSLTFVCGRYEGIDQRVIDLSNGTEVSLGEFVCAGGEAPAQVMIESIVRLIPGVLDEEAISKESFQEDNLEHPQYTRPEEWRGSKVPEVLLSGHHAQIQKWKEQNSKTNTKTN